MPQIAVSNDQHADLMRYAFGQIADPVDWKQPIDCIVPWGVANVYMQAVEFMTATKANCQMVDRGANGVFAHITAIGYRAGPAGQ